MLNKAKEYIRFLVTYSIVLIFTVLIIMDLVTFIIEFTENNYHDRATISIQKSTDIENLYTQILKKANIKEINSNEKSDLSKQNGTQNTVNNEKSDNNSSNNQSAKQDNSKVGNIDIYSTNKWRIKIPKLKLDAPITEGTTQEALRRTVGHFEQTDKWNGNVALAGHNRGYRCNFFQDIKQLQKGDIIIYSTEKGERKYQVVINKIIEETDWTYIKNTKDNRITLITCETNKKAYRRCIQAIEIK